MPLSTGDIIVTVNGTATTNFTFPKSNTTDTVVLNTPVSAGVPVIIGKNGIEKIIQINLSSSEKNQFKKSVLAVDELIKKCKKLLV